MKNKNFFDKLRQKQLEVSSVPTQNYGQFNPFYRGVSAYFKNDPWRVIIPVAIACVLLLKVTTGASITHIVSILQEGF